VHENVTDDRHSVHATQKCVGISKIAGDAKAISPKTSFASKSDKCHYLDLYFIV